MPKPRLLGQLSPSYLLLTTTAIAIVCWFAVHSLDSAAIGAARSRLENAGQFVGRQWAEDPSTAQRELLAEFCRDLAATSGAQITVISVDGNTLLGDRRTGEQEAWLERPEVHAALAGEAGSGIRYSPEGDDRTLQVAVPIVRRGQVLGVVHGRAASVGDHRRGARLANPRGTRRPGAGAGIGNSDSAALATHHAPAGGNAPGRGAVRP